MTKKANLNIIFEFTSKFCNVFFFKKNVIFLSFFFFNAFVFGIIISIKSFKKLVFWHFEFFGSQKKFEKFTSMSLMEIKNIFFQKGIIYLHLKILNGLKKFKCCRHLLRLYCSLHCNIKSVIHLFYFFIHDTGHIFFKPLLGKKKNYWESIRKL